MSNPDKNDPEAIKVILIGDSGTGKTNLITVAAGYQFNSDSLTTKACSFIQKIYNKHNANYTVNIWDTIGQEKFKSLTRIFVKESKIVILVYDITNKDSFDNLPFWKGLVDDILSESPILGIVGNKMDLYYNEQVKENELEEYANKIGAKFLLTSAKNDPDSIGIFIGGLLDDYLSKDKGDRIQSFVLNKEQIKKEKKKKCC